MDGPFLKLQSDTEAPIWKPLTIHNARETPQISRKEPNYQSLIPVFSSLAQDTGSNGAHVFRGHSLCQGWILQTGDLHWDSQRNPSLEPAARPRGHGKFTSPNWVRCSCAGLDDTRNLVEILDELAVERWPVHGNPNVQWRNTTKCAECKP
jgi:hypothetical protein